MKLSGLKQLERKVTLTRSRERYRELTSESTRPETTEESDVSLGTRPETSEEREARLARRREIYREHGSEGTKTA